MKELRLSWSQRITGVIWGLIVIGASVTAMVALSGTEVEIVNVIIVALAALGTWLLASALAAVRPRKAPVQADAVVADAAEADAVGPAAGEADAVKNSEV
jgi:hypothetical protein